jgi:hypothetical protein
MCHGDVDVSDPIVIPKEYECTICFKVHEDYMQYKCGHTICVECHINRALVVFGKKPFSWDNAGTSSSSSHENEG